MIMSTFHSRLNAIYDDMDKLKILKIRVKSTTFNQVNVSMFLKLTFSQKILFPISKRKSKLMGTISKLKHLTLTCKVFLLSTLTASCATFSED